MLCTGKCEINSGSRELKLRVESAPEIPSFFTKNADGDIVFAESRSMMTIKMPRGHYGTAVIRLKNVTSQQTEGQDFVCLGVKVDGTIVDKLYNGKSYRYVDMTDETAVELVPMVSRTKLSEGYTEAAIGSKVADSEIDSTNFDFGTVYRITVGDDQHLTWATQPQVEGKRLRDIAYGGRYNWINWGGIKLGPVKGKLKMLALHDNGRLASSYDGLTWEDESYLDGIETNEGRGCTPAYGNDVWCVVPTNAGTPGGRYSIDEAQTWSIHSMSISSYILCFHNSNFIAITERSNNVYLSPDMITWSLIGNVPTSNLMSIILYNHNDPNDLICVDFPGYAYESKDGGKNWSSITSDFGLNKLGSNWCYSCQIHGYFYAATDGGTVFAKSKDGKDWVKIDAPGNACGVISVINDKIYAFDKTGLYCSVGTFD